MSDQREEPLTPNESPDDGPAVVEAEASAEAQDGEAAEATEPAQAAEATDSAATAAADSATEEGEASEAASEQASTDGEPAAANDEQAVIEAASAVEEEASDAAAEESESQEPAAEPETVEAEQSAEQTDATSESQSADAASAADASADGADGAEGAEGAEGEVSAEPEAESEPAEAKAPEAAEATAPEAAEAKAAEAKEAADSSESDETPEPSEAQEVAEKQESSPAEGASTGDEAADSSATASTTDEAKDEGAKAEEAKTADDGSAPGTEAAAESDEANAERLKRQQETMVLIEKAHADKATIEGKVIGWNRGGYHVAIGEIAAFCPVSQIEIGNPRSPKRYMDRSFPFRVLEIEKGGRRVVLSRADALKAQREMRAAEVRGRLKVGETFQGKVSSLTPFGAFVSLGGGVEGLVHVSEISRKRVEKPEEVLKSGQKVKVQVIKVENGGKRVGLSMKRLEPDPWDGAEERFPAGGQFSGTILRKAEFGLFVEVEPGLEGLVHTSRLPIGKELNDDSLAEGNTVEGWVQECQPKRRRLSLSLREVAQGDPWLGVKERFQVGSVVTGKVERLAKFGVFIELEPGLTGLLPFAEVSLSPGANPRRRFHPGREVTVQVLDVDPSRRRLSLGTETSKAEGSMSDYRDYQKQQKKETSTGLGSLAAAFAKLQNTD